MQLAKQGIDDNTIYTQIGPSGSFEYAGVQFHPTPGQCFETSITPCYINREPEPYFPNGPQYDSGYMVSFTPDLDCDFDGLLIVPLVIALILVCYRFKTSKK